MKVKGAPCKVCVTPHTEDFCNDGFHVENSKHICARFVPSSQVSRNPRVDEWTYEVPKPELIA